MPEELGEEMIVRQSERTASRTIDGQAVVIVIDRNQLHRLNEVGSRVWQLAEEGRSISDIADDVVRDFEVDRARALCDVRAFIAELCGSGALELGRPQ